MNSLKIFYNFKTTHIDYDIFYGKSQILKNSKAGNATRTRDILLGKEVFYQLNYTRKILNIL